MPEEQVYGNEQPNYCWCGHEITGHSRSADGPMQCDGICPPNPDQRNCKCDTFVPANVAVFRMLESTHNHLVDFKLFIAAMVKDGDARDKGPRIVKPN